MQKREDIPDIWPCFYLQKETTFQTMTRIGELLPILVASFESRNFAFKGKFQTQGKIFNPKSQNITKGRKLFFFWGRGTKWSTSQNVSGGTPGRWLIPHRLRSYYMPELDPGRFCFVKIQRTRKLLWRLDWLDPGVYQERPLSFDNRFQTDGESFGVFFFFFSILIISIG